MLKSSLFDLGDESAGFRRRLEGMGLQRHTLEICQGMLIPEPARTTAADQPDARTGERLFETKTIHVWR
jgi:hypothetical protein